MVAAEGAVILLILVPLIGGAASLVGPRRTQWYVVGATAAVTALASLVLFMEVAGRGFEAIQLFMPEELSLAVEVLGAALALIFLYLGWRARSALVAIFAIGQLVMAVVIALAPAPRAGLLLIDTLALILVLITSMVGSLIALYSVTYMREDPRQREFLAVILGFLGVMNAAVMCNDLRWLDLFWGTTTLFSFLLIGHTRTDEARTAARLALIINTGGGLALLLGARLTEYYHGTYLLIDIPVGGVTGLALLPLALMSVAAFTKSAQLPFQSWLLGAMVAPTPVSALLHSSTMVNLGAFLVLRITSSFQGEPLFSAVIALVGGLSFLITSVLAMTQGNVKRVLAYSTIGNLGLIFMCAGVGTPLALAAGLVLLLYHAISKGLLFLAVGVVREERATEDIDDMYGLRRDMPLVTLSIFVGIATLVLPPFGMFVSKWLISEAAVAFPALAFLLAVGFAAIVVYYFKWLGVLLTSSDAPRRAIREDVSHRTYKWVLGALSAGAVAMSALVGPITNYLVAPFVAREFLLPGLTDTVTLFTAGGEVQAFLVLFLVALVLLVVRLFRRPRHRATVPYGGGEEVSFQAAGEYYLSDESISRVTRLGNAVGAVLIVVLLVVPAALEVL
jgi:ech hydrogenase subunit A